MNVIVADDSFKKGKMHGIVSLVDADGLLSDERLPLNRNEHGHVAYFYREWYDMIGICNNAFVYFGSPSPCYIAPFSPALEIYVKLFVTTADKCFQMCNRQKPIDLSEIWVDNIDYKRGTLRFEGKNGCILIDYIALRDAVDATMKLSLESPKDPLLKACVSGCIFAYYGDMLDGLEGLTKGCYKAIIFKAAEDGPKLDVGPLPLKKSVVAVPVNGTLVLEAHFFDESGKVILRKKCRFRAQTRRSCEWRMPLKKNCFLNLTVQWSKGQVATPFVYSTLTMTRNNY